MDDKRAAFELALLREEVRLNANQRQSNESKFHHAILLEECKACKSGFETNGPGLCHYCGHIPCNNQAFVRAGAVWEAWNCPGGSTVNSSEDQAASYGGTSDHPRLSSSLLERVNGRLTYSDVDGAYNKVETTSTSTIPSVSPSLQHDRDSSNEKRGHNDIEVRVGRSEGTDGGAEVPEKDRVASLFARRLFEKLDHVSTDRVPDDVFSELLLQYSTLLLASTKEEFEKNAALLIRERRSMIAKLLVNSKAPGVRPSVLVTARRPYQQSYRPQKRVSDKDAPGSQPEYEEHTRGIDFASEKVQNYLFKGREFDWLVRHITVAASTQTTGRVISDVRKGLTDAYVLYGQLRVETSWVPLDFFNIQYGLASTVVFSDVICVVGSSTAAEATTCGEYAARVWQNMGPAVMQGLDRALQNARVLAVAEQHNKHDLLPRAGMSAQDMPSTFRQRDGLDLHVEFEDYRTVITLGAIEGNDVPGCIEVAEIVCWLSAACQTSTRPNEVVLCTPEIVREPADAIVVVEHKLTPAVTSDITAGQPENCWHRIFSNSAIVHGYPIAPRRPGQKGLRIPLDMMALLACTPRATSYAGQLLLKGVCSMFVPVLTTATSVIWHYVLNDDFSLMSHDQVQTVSDASTTIGFNDIESMEHYVGWTTRVDNLTGQSSCESSVHVSSETLLTRHRQ